MTSSTKSPLPLVFIDVGPIAGPCPADAEISSGEACIATRSRCR